MERLSIVILGVVFYLICSVNPEKSVRSIQPSGIEINDIIYPADYWNRNLIFKADVEKRELDRELKEEDELIRVLKNTSVPIDPARWDSVGDRVISRANVTEETKRIVRHIKKQRPGFFWTLFRVTFETINDTRSAVQQISDLVSNAFSSETTTQKFPAIMAPKKSENNETNSEENPPGPELFRPTVQEFQSLIRRNVKGLVRLFNIEWTDAIKQSQKNVKQFKKELGKSVAPFLADNPNIN